MKKQFCVLLLAICLFGLVGCQTQGATQSQETNEEVATTQPKESASEATEVPKEPEEPIKTEPVLTENAVFRNIAFGMTMEQVKAAEKEHLEEDGNSLYILSCQIAGVETGVKYEFNDNDELSRIYASDNEDHSTENEYVKEYEAYVEALTEKYGEPTEVKEIWYDDLFQDDPNDLGLAVSLGDFLGATFWEFEEYQVGAVMTGADYDIDVGFVITSHEFEEATTSSGM